MIALNDYRALIQLDAPWRPEPLGPLTPAAATALVGELRRYLLTHYQGLPALGPTADAPRASAPAGLPAAHQPRLPVAEQATRTTF